MRATKTNDKICRLVMTPLCCIIIIKEKKLMENFDSESPVFQLTFLAMTALFFYFFSVFQNVQNGFKIVSPQKHSACTVRHLE